MPLLISIFCALSASVCAFRIIMTSSSSGLYGSYGQANYSAGQSYYLVLDTLSEGCVDTVVDRTLAFQHSTAGLQVFFFPGISFATTVEVPCLVSGSCL